MDHNDTFGVSILWKSENEPNGMYRTILSHPQGIRSLIISQVMMTIVSIKYSFLLRFTFKEAVLKLLQQFVNSSSMATDSESIKENSCMCHVLNGIAQPPGRQVFPYSRAFLCSISRETYVRFPGLLSQARARHRCKVFCVIPGRQLALSDLDHDPEDRLRIDALRATCELVDDWQLSHRGKITIMRDYGEAALIQRCR